MVKINLKKSFILFFGILFVFCMHYYQPNPGGYGVHLPFNAVSWLAISILISIGIYNISIYKKISYSRMSCALLICCVFLTLPMFYYNANISKSIYRIIALWCGWLLLLSLQQFKFKTKENHLFLWFILFGSLIEIIYSWYQFKFISFDNLIGYDTVVNRPYGIFQQPNVMASFIATGLAISGYLLSTLPDKFGARHVIILITPILFIPIITVLNSRTGWICAFVSTLFVLPSLFYRAKLRKFGSIWVMSLLLGCTLNTTSIVHDSWTGVDSKLNLHSPRMIHFPQVFNMILEKPLYGYGYGNFDTAYIEQTAKWHHQNEEQYPGITRLEHPHNEILYWVVEGGVIPLLAISLAAFAIISNLFKISFIKSLALIGMLFPLIFHSMVEYPFYHSIIHWVIFIVLMYFLDCKFIYKNEIKLKNTSVGKVFAVIFPVCIFGYMLSSLYSGLQLNKFEIRRPYDTRYLAKVNNKLSWGNRLEWDLNVNNLRLGIKNYNHKLINDYIFWAKVKIQDWPEPDLYRSLIDAYKAIGDVENAFIVKNQAMYLYPDLMFE
ncbi:Wzy polymerase domain-containing protein [Photobacterium damselae]|uniref:Wzy polymerase domain-containing protein n=1 Tax=Photobacterium damselae TaxID=38293 RepID=UPI0040679DCF